MKLMFLIKQGNSGLTIDLENQKVKFVTCKYTVALEPHDSNSNRISIFLLSSLIG